MNGFTQMLRQIKAIFRPTLPGGMKKIYADFFKYHEDRNVMMLHRKDLYTSGPPQAQASDKMLDLIQRYGGHRILDIGCGHGVNCTALNNRGFECIGIELNEKYAEEAKNYIEAHNMNAENLEFQDKSFDTVIMLEVLEHIENPHKAMEEIVRVAKKNLIVSVPNLAPLEVTVEYNMIMHHFFETTHLNFFTKPMLERFLSKYFPYVEVGGFGQFFNISGRKLFYHLSAVASFEPIV